MNYSRLYQLIIIKTQYLYEMLITLHQSGLNLYLEQVIISVDERVNFPHTP